MAAVSGNVSLSRRVCIGLLLGCVTALEASSRNGRRERERSPVQVFLLGGDPVECARLVASAAHSGAPAAEQPPYPNHDMVAQLQMPPDFIDRVQPIAAFPADAVVHQHLRHFCFPRQACGPFPSEGEPAYFHTFSLTNEDGGRNHGACLTMLCAERYGLTGLLEGKTVARPLSIVVFSPYPLYSIHEAFLRQLWAERREHKWDATSAGSPLCASIERYVRALTESAARIDRLLSHGLFVPHERQLSAVMRALRWQPDGLAAVLIGALTNGKVLVVSSDSALPPALIGAAIALLFPLEYPGVVVPLLPRSLHPDPATLINDNVAPFLIGCDAELAADIAPYSNDLLVIDLDSGNVRWPTPDPYEQWLRSPVAQRLVTALRAYADSDDELSLAGIRAGCLRFVLDLVDLDDGALSNSAHPADRSCAAQWRLCGRLIEDVLAAARDVSLAEGSELEEPELQRNAQLCRAAYVRELCASEPLGARSGRDSNLPLLRDAYASTACSEYLSVPHAERVKLPEAQWLHWRRLGAQFECSVHEHHAGTLVAHELVALELRAKGVALCDEPVAAHGDDWPQPAPFSAPSVEVITDFCDAFDAPVVGELIACAPCVLHDRAASAGLAGTPASLTCGPELAGVLLSGRLYVTESHLCFQAAGELVQRKDVVALAQVAQLKLQHFAGGITVSTVSGFELRMLGIHRAASLHALITELIQVRANGGVFGARPGQAGRALASQWPANAS